ncbi:MAG TPA: IclR family transcriptional regulator [Xanthobacteraceae bacterium]|jgi:DNA-binding IclR family transcriptional regulator
MPRSPTKSVGIQSVEVSAALLRALAENSGPMTLTNLAKEARMSLSKAHKYLASFIRIGLVRQDGISGRYMLGRFAAELGFAAMRNIDVVEIAQETLDTLRDRLDTTAALSVWGSQGPTVVRKALNLQPVSLLVQLGTVTPLLTSSTGRVFAAYLDRRKTKSMIERELAERKGAAARSGLRTMADVERLLSKVRKEGMAIAIGLMHPGVIGMSAPIFDIDGDVIATINLAGMEGVLDTRPHGPVRRALREAAADLSHQLGQNSTT